VLEANWADSVQPSSSIQTIGLNSQKQAKSLILPYRAGILLLLLQANWLLQQPQAAHTSMAVCPAGVSACCALLDGLRRWMSFSRSRLPRMN
jgi:hypothetical protein